MKANKGVQSFRAPFFAELAEIFTDAPLQTLAGSTNDAGTVVEPIGGRGSRDLYL